MNDPIRAAIEQFQRFLLGTYDSASLVPSAPPKQKERPKEKKHPEEFACNQALEVHVSTLALEVAAGCYSAEAAREIHDTIVDTIKAIHFTIMSYPGPLFAKCPGPVAESFGFIATAFEVLDQKYKLPLVTFYPVGAALYSVVRACILTHNDSPTYDADRANKLFDEKRLEQMVRDQLARIHAICDGDDEEEKDAANDTPSDAPPSGNNGELPEDDASLAPASQ